MYVYPLVFCFYIRLQYGVGAAAAAVTVSPKHHNPASKPQAAAILRKKERDIASDWNRVQLYKSEIAAPAIQHLHMATRVKLTVPESPPVNATNATWKETFPCKFFIKYDGTRIMITFRLQSLSE